MNLASLNKTFLITSIIKKLTFLITNWTKFIIMKKQIFLACLGLASLFSAQVGINTESPDATLDIVGKPATTTAIDGLLPPRLTGDQLKAKDSVYGANQNGTIVYVTAAVGTSSTKTVNVKSPGYYYYNAPNNVWVSFDSGGTGTTLYASRSGSWSLATLGITGTNWNKISLTSTDTKTGLASLLNNGVYTAPKTGLYAVTYEVQLEGGVDLGLLGGKKLGIVKNASTLFEQKIFDAVRVSILGVTLASVPVTSTTLQTVIHLNAGETITFAIETGGVNLTLLTDSKVAVSVYKVSES
ncbi:MULTISPECIES: hypothetical protein [Chryseobacterium]|uniref:hypothetical protein n=1 Tax=Chryseobacterium TaxID=59732 RepID=UPI00195B541D|nr:MULTISPECIES: hypothetical protein [Chryseobacterium]MBM7420272.1 hypothetical protein [Chryseobacterium sp. JUb44]MDH6210216.1 hypothetical protein [Chryseobacterium sp. BIGb0186]WSO08933.1 hypothetical protein VUJ64_13980 [Chryseobacterium scophthalmum]